MSFIVNKVNKTNPRTINELQLKGYFSFDNKRTLHLNNSSQLRYYHPPTDRLIDFDLNNGIESALPKVESPNEIHLDSILRWILNHEKEVRTSPECEQWLEPKFICWRSAIEIIMKVPFTNDGWTLCAAKWKGNIYLRMFDSETTKFEKADPRSLKMMYWKNKLAQHVLSESPDKSPDCSEPVDINMEFHGIFQSQIGDHKLLYTAPIRGIISEQLLTDPLPLDKLKIIEVFTNRVIKTSTHDGAFRMYKFINWWTKSILTGIDNVLCAFRDDCGIVKNFKNYKPSELAELGKPFWNANAMMNFANEFLTHIAQTVVNDCDKTIYEFERIKREDATVCAEIHMTELPPDSENSFLPTWYVRSST